MSEYVDVNGKISSKRKQGRRFLTVTLIFCITYFFLLIIAWLINKPLFAFPTQLVAVTGGIGTTLLGVTVFETPKPNIEEEEEEYIEK